MITIRTDRAPGDFRNKDFSPEWAGIVRRCAATDELLAFVEDIATGKMDLDQITAAAVALVQKVKRGLP